MQLASLEFHLLLVKLVLDDFVRPFLACAILIISLFLIIDLTHAHRYGLSIIALYITCIIIKHFNGVLLFQIFEYAFLIGVLVFAYFIDEVKLLIRQVRRLALDIAYVYHIL